MRQWIAAAFLPLAGFANQNLAINQLLYEIRKPETGPKEFRESLEKIGEYLAFEVSNGLSTETAEVATLTGGVASHSLCSETPVLVTLLRAGVPLCAGVQKIFPDSPVGFIGIARNEETLLPEHSYVSLPEIQGKTVVIIDTMLATGGSFLSAIDIVKPYRPARIILIAAIAAEPGIANIRNLYPDIEIHTAGIDPALNQKGYIVPGLGDAGDRSYGEKMKLKNP